MYKLLKVNCPKSRPYFYTDFVSTLDGKVKVLTDSPGYWPIGSQLDYSVYTSLRAQADILIQGKTTARLFPSTQTFTSQQFLSLRKKFKQSPHIPYLIVSAHPDDGLVECLKGYNQGMVATTNEAKVPAQLSKIAKIIRVGQTQVDLNKLAQILIRQNYKKAFVDGGLILLGSFLKVNLIDEIFVTIAPKIFGTSQVNPAITMVEGVLLSPDQIKLKLVKATIKDSEIFLRYKVL